MAVNQQRYGGVKPIAFKLTKNGIAVTNQTFTLGDLQTRVVNGTNTTWSNVPLTDITNLGLGWYLWTPSETLQTSGELVLLNIKDADGTDFNENGLCLETGGDDAARHDGT